MSNVKLLRLTSGEEIVGTVNYLRGQYTITEACNLVSAGEGKLAFIPFMAYIEPQPVVINESHVVFCVEPTQELKDQVSRFYGKIEVASQKIVTS